MEKAYPVGYLEEVPVRLAIGWSDERSEHYARIETDSEQPETLRLYSPSSDEFAYSLMLLLVHLKDEIQEVTGLNDFELPGNDLKELQDAPFQRLVDSSELVTMDMLDTEYAAQLEGDEAGAVETEHSIARHSLSHCVSVLSELQERENTGNLHSFGTLAELRSSILAQTIADLVPNIEELGDAISGEAAYNLANGDYTQLWNFREMLNLQDIVHINNYVRALCGENLTDFQQAVSRGYNPVTGLPLECPNPELFSWRSSIPDSSEELYRQHGLNDYTARRMVDIQRTDPRYRLEEDWEFLYDVTQQLFSNSSTASDSRQNNPSEIVHLNILDTEYANNINRYTDMFGEPVRAENLELEVAESLKKLELCVETLKGLYRIQSGENEDLLNSYGTIEMRQQSVIAQTAVELVQSNYEFITSISSENLGRINTATFDAHELWDINSIFNEAEVETINTFTHNLCGSKLADFTKAIERGYDPTTGLPLDCLDSAAFSWESTVGENTIEQYKRYGLSVEDAVLMVQIQRTDPRYRDEDAWNFMMEATNQLTSITQYLKEKLEDRL